MPPDIAAARDLVAEKWDIQLQKLYSFLDRNRIFAEGIADPSPGAVSAVSETTGFTFFDDSMSSAVVSLTSSGKSLLAHVGKELGPLHIEAL